jgi:hypothetical protein
MAAMKKVEHLPVYISRNNIVRNYSGRQFVFDKRLAIRLVLVGDKYRRMVEMDRPCNCELIGVRRVRGEASRGVWASNGTGSVGGYTVFAGDLVGMTQAYRGCTDKKIPAFGWLARIQAQATWICPDDLSDPNIYITPSIHTNSADSSMTWVAATFENLHNPR